MAQRPPKSSGFVTLCLPLQQDSRTTTTNLKGDLTGDRQSTADVTMSP